MDSISERNQTVRDTRPRRPRWPKRPCASPSTSSGTAGSGRSRRSGTAHAGFDVDAGDGSQPEVRLRRGRRNFIAGLSHRVPGHNLYSRVTLVTLVTTRRPIENETLARLNLELDAVRVCRHDATSVLLAMPLRLDGGVTVAWVRDSLGEWLTRRRRCERVLIRASQSRGFRLEPGEPASSVIH